MPACALLCVFVCVCVCVCVPECALAVHVCSGACLCPSLCVCVCVCVCVCRKWDEAFVDAYLSSIHSKGCEYLDLEELLLSGHTDGMRSCIPVVSLSPREPLPQLCCLCQDASTLLAPTAGSVILAGL